MPRIIADKSETVRGRKSRKSWHSCHKAEAPSKLYALEHQQTDRNQRQPVHHRMNLFAPSDHQIKRDVGDEAPEDALRDRKCQRDKNQCHECWYAFFNLREVDLANALKHR